jgi:8-oxo-dGTP pyrophosphatase MutT (NUDIX family)
MYPALAHRAQFSAAAAQLDRACKSVFLRENPRLPFLCASVPLWLKTGIVTFPALCDTKPVRLRPPMVREFSAGGVVLRKMRGRWFMAVIEPHMTRSKKATAKAKARRKATTSLIALPKGTIDPGEKPDQTALREVREETGVQADLIRKLADIKYRYVRNWGDNARVFKIVSFYLLLYRSGKLGNIAPEMRIEVQKAFWLPLEDAPTTLNYQGEREVVQLALDYVQAHPELGTNAANTTH